MPREPAPETRARWDWLSHDTAPQFRELRISYDEVEETAELVRSVIGSGLWPPGDPVKAANEHPFGFALFRNALGDFFGRKLPTRAWAPSDVWVFFIAGAKGR